MHSNNLMIVRNNDLQDYPFAENEEKELHEKIEETKAMADGYVKEIFLDQYNNYLNPFYRKIYKASEQMMDKFCCECENENILEFDDETEYVNKSYESDTITAVKLAGGKIVPYYYISDRFICKNGYVYERNVGKYHQDIRNKKARKLTALESYSVKKLMSKTEFADYLGYSYDEEHHGFGCMYNPYSEYDYIIIGGRWGHKFIVKNSVIDCIVCGEGSDKEAPPEGYKFVAAARKKDIEWDIMREYNDKSIKEQYKLVNSYFDDNIDLTNTPLHIEGNDLYQFNEKIFTKGDSFEDFVRKNYLYPIDKYDVRFCNYMMDNEYTKYHNWGDMDQRKEYQKELIDLIDSLDPEDVLVSMDAHF